MARGKLDAATRTQLAKCGDLIRKNGIAAQ